MFDVDERSSSFLDDFDEKAIMDELSRGKIEPMGDGLFDLKPIKNFQKHSVTEEANIYAVDGIESINDLIKT
jgi:hypothetical protein